MVAQAASAGRCALISDETVASLWGLPVGADLRGEGIDAVPVTFPPGESNKTRETWADLTDALVEAGLGRDSCVVSLGGGVVGDVAGFVAATYMRSVPFVQVPTTTLAMIDASVGGKTGVDHPVAKNMVGAFHPPAAVLADPDFLGTLDKARRAEGFAEAIKHGVILDDAYAEWLIRRAPSLLSGNPDDVARAVVRSVELKAGVVSADEFEVGARQILNFGHTVGHALEAASGYTLSHGHAVAAGMVAEARIGEALGVTAPGTGSEIRAMVQAFGLPSDPAGLMEAERLAALMARDKKVRDGVVHLVLLKEVGKVSPLGPAVPVPGREVVGILEGWVANRRSTGSP